MVTQRLIEADAERCHSCSSGLQTSDNFCRSCGTSQKIVAVIADNNESRRRCETTVLNNDNEIEKDESLSSSLDDTLIQTETYESLSSPLVKTLTQNIATRTSSLRPNRFGTSLIAALIAIPIWLLIILLSPIDAYTAIRAVASQMNCK